MDSPTYRFGPFEIKRAEKLLRRNGEPVPLPPKAIETLLLLVQSRGEVVAKEDIINAVWPDAVVEENNLSQQISILRKTLGDGAGGDGWIQTVPKRGYRFIAPVNTPPVATDRAVSRAAGRRTPLVLGAIVVVIALIIVLASFATRPEEIRSVAVLPIQPLTANEELSAVGLGISDAVVQRLSYARGLNVRPMTSVRKYLGKPTDALTVGRELNVDAVVAGTIQRDQDRYRITMELVDVRSNRSRWSGKIEEKVTDIFRLQDIVAEATLRSMPSGTRPVPAAKIAGRVPVPAAHEAFLKGRYYWSRRTRDDVERSIREFERAVSLDGGYAAAWAGLASSINLQTTHFLSEPAPAFARARSAANQALLLDPNLAEAHAALGFISFYYDWNWSEAETAFRRAIQLDRTNGNYRQLLSNLMVATSRFDEAIQQIEEAIRSDPASIMVRAVAGRQYYLAGRHEESVAILRQAIDMDSSFAASHYNLGTTLVAMGKRAEAVQELEEAMRKNYGPQGILALAIVAANDGKMEEARRRISEAQALTRNGVSLHYDMATVNVALGDFDAAFAELDQAISKRHSGMVWLNIDPRLDPLRADPRFAEYVHRTGFSPASRP